VLENRGVRVDADRDTATLGRFFDALDVERRRAWNDARALARSEAT
jgi:hypothetical protein